MTPQRVSLITLGVSDLRRSREFYGNLGWTEAPRGGETIVFYQLKGLVLGLFGRDALAEDQGRSAVELGTGAMTLALNMPNTKGVDHAFESALKAGAKVIKKPEEVFWGGYSGYYGDPDGHVWEVAYNPYWPLEEDGSLTLPEPE